MQTLREVLTLPTAPFHEQAVASYIITFCRRLNLKIKDDKVGNLIVHYKKGRSNQPVIFQAHMDHPGFEIISVNCESAEIGVMGTINLDYMEGTALLFQTENGIVNGTVGKRTDKQWHSKPVFEIEIRDKVKVGDFGWLDIPAFEIKDDILYTKAADNLVSCSALLGLMETVVTKNLDADIRFVFTRAEEVIMVGCVALARQKLLPKNVPIIVLECSSAKAGKVQIGGGPVVRVGDKLSCFKQEIDYWLTSAANEISEKDKTFKFQRALLGGGRCEASIWTVMKYMIGGLAFPLGNYHNNGDTCFSPEYISLSDFKMMNELLLRIATCKKTPAEVMKNSCNFIWENYETWKDKLWTS